MSNNGYSYKITITAEELSRPSQISGMGNKSVSLLQAPIVDSKRTPSHLNRYLVSRLHHFAFNKIVEPRFTGMGQYTGQPTNFPDFISEHHLIGIMRATEICLRPDYEAVINSSGGTNGT